MPYPAVSADGGFRITQGEKIYYQPVCPVFESELEHSETGFNISLPFTGLVCTGISYRRYSTDSMYGSCLARFYPSVFVCFSARSAVITTHQHKSIIATGLSFCYRFTSNSFERR
jgi:hypothetical protein